jgi:1,4-dihydroxy-6-naphthoate synthase
VRANAQEMSEDVVRQHIALYVNEYSVDLGRDGRRAVEVLFKRAAAAGVVRAPSVPLFASR